MLSRVHNRANMGQSNLLGRCRFVGGDLRHLLNGERDAGVENKLLPASIEDSLFNITSSNKAEEMKENWSKRTKNSGLTFDDCFPDHFLVTFPPPCSLEDMSQIRESSHNPRNFLAIPIEKSGDIFTLLIKGVLAIFLVASISLVFFSAFSKHSRTIICPDYDSVFTPSGSQSEINHQIPREEYEDTNISHIVFGIGGTAKTWNDRRHYVESWWTPKITRGFVWLDEKPNLWWTAKSPPYRVSEDSSRFKHGSSPSAVRIARIVSESFRLGLKNVRWFVLGDDDTVFFTENLVSVLSKYDHNQMYYIGGNSESVEQDVRHTYAMAFGGGGFAISYPLAAELVRVLDGCIDRYFYFYGSDERIQACLAEIGVPVTKELGFHQFDIRGDPYGLLAAHPVAPLVTLHHLDDVKSLFPSGTRLDSLRSLRKAYKVDPGRTVQQSFCYDLSRNWSVSVAWGYTAQIYPFLLSAKDLGTPLQTFQTWSSWQNEPFTFNTLPMSTEPCERPVVFFLDRVEEVNGGGTRTSYKRLAAEPGKNCERVDYVPALSVKSLNVLATKMERDAWKKAPRRQCCEIINGKGGVERVVQVRIRSCSLRESVTPP
ncbi:hypothetical protein HHK36_016343 [Tetracentron sinense]|uniref:Uncharacterized protein n=1 Tax=Tetracentron sinense TaxID=13715 RepID=A0A835DE46_TETSI|nr:hypothetical protein HHK36_016343 [Tetracentron sinense]